MKFLLPWFCVAAGTGVLFGQFPEANPNVAKEAGLKLEVSPKKDAYAVGEPIDVELKYSVSNNSTELRVLAINGEREDGLTGLGFEGKDENGKDLAPIETIPFAIDRSTSIPPLTMERPYRHSAVVNDWLRISRPGWYEVTARSSIVMQMKGDKLGGAVAVKGAPAWIRIVEAEPSWRDAMFSEAEAVLRRKKPGSRKESMLALRYLLDERAIPLFLDAMSDLDLRSEAMLGLISLPGFKQVKEAVAARLRDRPIEESEWIGYYVMVLSTAQPREQKAVAKSGADVAAGEENSRQSWEAFVVENCLAKIDSLPGDQAAVVVANAMILGPSANLTLEYKKTFVRNASKLPSAKIRSATIALYGKCRDISLIRELLALAGDKFADPALRSGAMVNLLCFGCRQFQDDIVEDLRSDVPKLSPPAWKAIGSYRSKEIADSLLAKAVAGPPERRIDTAVLIRDFGVGVSVADLEKTISQLCDSGRFNAPALVEALANRSEAAALPFAKKMAAGETNSDLRESGWQLLARLPQAVPEVREELTTPTAARRRKMIKWLRDALTDSQRPSVEDLSPYSSHNQKCRSGMSVVLRLLPELEKLAAEDPDKDVRWHARELIRMVAERPETEKSLPAGDVPLFHKALGIARKVGS